MSGFELIAQELLKQQQHMQKLDAENRELRQQLADLRAGHGIFIEIAGQRFPLEGTMPLPQPVTTSTEAQEDLPLPRTTTSLQEEAPAPVVITNGAIDRENEEEEESMPVVESVSSESTPVEIASVEEEESQQEAPTFLEEIMLDEFAAATTSPMAVWNGPVNKQDAEPIDEEQKAALRRELMGSFLLE
jgi:hypothetical protein